MVNEVEYQTLFLWLLTYERNVLFEPSIDRNSLLQPVTSKYERDVLLKNEYLQADCLTYI